MKNVERTTADWLTRPVSTPTLKISVNNARKELTGRSDSDVCTIWNRLEEIFDRWKHEHGLEPNRGARSLATAPPYMCAGLEVPCYANLLSLLMRSRYPPLSRAFSNKEKFTKLLAVIILHDAFCGSADNALLAHDLLLGVRDLNLLNVVLGEHKDQLNSLDPGPRLIAGLAIRGSQAIRGSTMGARTRFGTPQQQQAKKLEYQAEVNRAYKQNPRLSFNRLCVFASKKFGVSPRTIARYTKKPSGSPARNRQKPYT